MTIPLTPDQIRDLARQINETIRGLTDIDAILEATKENLDKAQRLKERADNARYFLNNQCDVVMDSRDRLEEEFRLCELFHYITVFGFIFLLIYWACATLFSENPQTKFWAQLYEL